MLPIRVVTTSPKAPPADQISAIEVAVSAGATVLALGSYIDPDDPNVAKAIADAVDHNAVVVFAAPTGTGSSTDDGKPGVLRVGGIGVDNTPAAQYRPGAVDVVAPGMDISSLGIMGTGVSASTGTHVAVAYVAGEVALVRAAHPDLTPAQVTHRVELTADKQTQSVPDSTYGWGIINPAGAVNAVIAAEDTAGAATAEPPAASEAGHSPSSGRIVAVVLVVLVGLVAATGVALRIRNLVRTGSGEGQQGRDNSHEDPETSDVRRTYESWPGAGRREESEGSHDWAHAGGAETARPSGFQAP